VAALHEVGGLVQVVRLAAYLAEASDPTAHARALWLSG
jgi:hypothetical protein